jgi:hypothetical protein
MDARVKLIHRRFEIDIFDETPIDFSNKDLERIAEEFEDSLQKRFAVRVDNIEVRTIKR